MRSNKSRRPKKRGSWNLGAPRHLSKEDAEKFYHAPKRSRQQSSNVLKVDNNPPQPPAFIFDLGSDDDDDDDEESTIPPESEKQSELKTAQTIPDISVSSCSSSSDITSVRTMNSTIAKLAETSLSPTRTVPAKEKIRPIFTRTMWFRCFRCEVTMDAKHAMIPPCGHSLCSLCLTEIQQTTAMDERIYGCFFCLRLYDTKVIRTLAAIHPSLPISMACSGHAQLSCAYRLQCFPCGHLACQQCVLKSCIMEELSQRLKVENVVGLPSSSSSSSHYYSNNERKARCPARSCNMLCPLSHIHQARFPLLRSSNRGDNEEEADDEEEGSTAFNPVRTYCCC